MSKTKDAKVGDVIWSFKSKTDDEFDGEVWKISREESRESWDCADYPWEDFAEGAKDFYQTLNSGQHTSPVSAIDFEMEYLLDQLDEGRERDAIHKECLKRKRSAIKGDEAELAIINKELATLEKTEAAEREDEKRMRKASRDDFRIIKCTKGGFYVQDVRDEHIYTEPDKPHPTRAVAEKWIKDFIAGRVEDPIVASMKAAKAGGR